MTAPAPREGPSAYAGFGLNFESDLECPAFPEASGPVDVEIRMGRVPEHLDPPVQRGVTFEAQTDRVLLTFPGVGRFLIESGRRITVEPSANASEDAVRVFLTGPALAALLLQRGLFLLHAAACELPAGTVLLAGSSGRGKSTVLAALLARGHRLVADDLAAVTLDDAGHPVVHTASSSLKLFPDSLRKVGFDCDAFATVRQGVSKLWVSPRAESTAAPGPHCVAGVCTLDYGDARTIQFTRVRGQERLLHINRNRYAPFLTASLRLHERQFPIAAALATKTSVVRISRPRTLVTLDALTDAIEDHFRWRD